MAEKNNATCSICGRGYYMCLACKDAINLSPWRRHTDTSEHYKIYQILHGYNTRVYSKEEAKSKLKMVDLSDFDSLRDNIKNLIKDIIGENNDTVDNAVDLVNKVEISNNQRVIRKKRPSKEVGTE